MARAPTKATCVVCTVLLRRAAADNINCIPDWLRVISDVCCSIGPSPARVLGEVWGAEQIAVSIGSKVQGTTDILSPEAITNTDYTTRETRAVTLVSNPGQQSQRHGGSQRTPWSDTAPPRERTGQQT